MSITNVTLSWRLSAASLHLEPSSSSSTVTWNSISLSSQLRSTFSHHAQEQNPLVSAAAFSNLKFTEFPCLSFFTKLKSWNKLNLSVNFLETTAIANSNRQNFALLTWKSSSCAYIVHESQTLTRRSALRESLVSLNKLDRPSIPCKNITWEFLNKRFQKAYH